MTTATAAPARGVPTGPEHRPERLQLLAPMLAGTRRGGVPIRRAFLQAVEKHDGQRGGPLSRLVRDSNALDAYLLIHALASSSHPYDTWHPPETWAQVARLNEFVELDAAKSRWAKVVTKLVDLNLVRRKRVGNKQNYVLLNESGSTEPYTRPTKAADGNWFGLPHLYWTGEFDAQLSMPEKVMLLISLDQRDGFRLPPDRGLAWYGISESTVRRGLQGLVDRDILWRTTAHEADPKSPTGWKEVHRYTTIGDWSLASRKKSMSRRPLRAIPRATASPE